MLIILSKIPKRQKSILALNIIRRRKERGWSQMKLAEISGVGLTTIKEIETDKSEGWPSTRDAIAGSLGCSKEDLYQKPVESKWESMTQKQMVDLIVSLQTENDRLKELLKIGNATSIEEKIKENDALRALIKINEHDRKNEKYRRASIMEQAGARDYSELVEATEGSESDPTKRK